MKNYLKRILALALVLVMAVGFVPASVFAAGTAPALPTVTVTQLEDDAYAAAVNIKSATPTNEQSDYYGSWNAEIEVSFNKAVTLNADGSANAYLALGGESFGGAWYNLPLTSVDLAADETFDLMQYVFELTSGAEYQPKYADVRDAFNNVDLGIYIDEAFEEANPDLQATVQLRIYNETESHVLASYTYGAPALPTATVSELEKDGLTFALNFLVDTPTDEQLAYYGNWYADFELSVNKDVTFNAASETSDGYLSGEYGEYGWVNAPITDVTLKANETLKIMDYAATLLGEPGLKYTYAEVCEAVQNFNCGVFFKDAFLEANPDLKVTLNLKMYNPANESENYVIGDTMEFTAPTAPELPTATATQIQKDDLTYAMNFKVDEVTDWQLAYYGNWYADFELTVSKDMTFNAASETSDGYLSGEYGEYGWVNAPITDVTLKAGESLKIMDYASTLLGEPGLKYTFKEVYEAVQNFNCGVFIEPQFLLANPDLVVTLELKMYDPANEKESYTVGVPYTFTVAEAPELPTATAIDLANDELTFAMNFKADEVTAEQLAYYGKWYADFELTVNKTVTLDANGTGDGWLSGQYDGEWESWHGTWMNVPFHEPVTLQANEPLKIMAFAAEVLGEPGLKYTYKEVYEVVQNFNCGAYFTPEFLAANPDLEVTLELKMYNPHDESISHKIGQTYVFENDFVAYNVETGKLYTKVSEATMAAATAGQTVRLMKDTTDVLVNVLDGVTLDLNGYTLEASYIFSVGDVVDDSAANTGALKVSDKHMMLQLDNRQLPVNTADGYKFFQVLGFNAAEIDPGKENAIKYAFQPKFEAAAHEWLLAGNAASNVTIGVHVTWPNDQGGGSQIFTYSDEMVQTVLNSYRPNDGGYAQMYTLVINGTDAYPGLSCQGFVAFGAGSAKVEFAVPSATN